MENSPRLVPMAYPECPKDSAGSGAAWSFRDQNIRPKVIIRPNLATRLTQAHRREAKGAPALKVEVPKPDTLCRGCGTKIPRGKRHCQQCAVPLTRQNFDASRIIA